MEEVANSYSLHKLSALKSIQFWEKYYGTSVTLVVSAVNGGSSGAIQRGWDIFAA
jgi:hypothetical protein